MKPWTRLTTLIHLVPWLAGVVVPLAFIWAFLAFVRANYSAGEYAFCGLGVMVGSTAMGMAIIGAVGILAVLARARKTGKGAGDDEVQS